MLGVVCQVAQLMRVFVDLEEFLRRTGVGEYLMLVGVGFACGMGLPKLDSRRVVVIRFVTKVGLFGEIVPDLEKVPEADHTFVCLINVPVVLGKNKITGLALRFSQDRGKAHPLNALIFFGTGQFQNGGTDIDATNK